MANIQLTKFGVPIVGQAMSSTGSVRHRTGTCGIEPLKQAGKPPPPPELQLPQHLIRPPCSPCMPGAEQRKTVGNCGSRFDAFFCPPQKAKFRYPPFSENIDFVPTGDAECWWATPRVCDVSKEDDDLLTRP